MTKGELIRSLEGLMDETEIVVGTISTNRVWDILTVGYMKSRADEPAYIRLAISGGSVPAKNSEQGDLT
jgi:hypothetical protein